MNGVTLGHMWGAIFDSDINAIISGFALMNGAVVGSGHVVSRKNANMFIKFQYFVIVLDHLELPKD